MNKPAKKSGAIIGRFPAFALMLVVSLLMLSACAVSAPRHAMAPPPPITRDVPLTRPEPSVPVVHFAVEKTRENPPAPSMQTPLYEVALNAKKPAGKKCRIKDRFDRKMLFAYEFDDDQSRLGFDVDGIALDNMNVEQVRVEFRYKFSAGKTKKQKCRYQSSYQGLVGSAYNELFIRDKDTVWTELDDRGLNFWR